MESPKKEGGVKRKHRALSIAEKVEILKKLDNNVSVRTICETYGIGMSTVYDIKKQKEKLLKFFSESGSKKQMLVKKSVTHGKCSELERTLLSWFNLRVSEGAEVSGDSLKEQAKVFHEQLGLQHSCDYSEGWLYRFKSRHGLKFKELFGEKRSSDKEASPTAYLDGYGKSVTDENLSPENNYAENQLIHELTDYVNDVNHTDSKELSSKLSENILTEWMNYNDNVSMTHNTDSRILNMVENTFENTRIDNYKDEQCDNSEEEIKERKSLDRLIALTFELLTGLEQKSFISEQEIINVYLLQNKLIKERLKYMTQQTLPELMKDIALKQGALAAAVSTLENPLPSTSSQPDVLSPQSIVPPSIETIPVGDVTAVKDEVDPNCPSAV